MLKGQNGINQEFSNRNTIEKCSLKYLEIKQHVAKYLSGSENNLQKQLQNILT